MTITGNEDHNITLAEASEMTGNYRNANPAGKLGFAFGKTAIQDILNQPNCTGIRIYFGQTNAGERNLIVTGVDVNGNDLYNGNLAEYCLPSPPDNSAVNPLNS
ncbi:hypothetical protein GYB22_00595 [bacterium]|nr:hypothetical protein [bacterium]